MMNSSITEDDTFNALKKISLSEMTSIVMEMPEDKWLILALDDIREAEFFKSYGWTWREWQDAYTYKQK